MRICLFFVVAAASCAARAAEVVEVSPSGSLKTPAEAVAHIRELRQSGRLGVDQPVTIRIAAGLYELPDTLNLSAADSGLTFEGAPGGKTVLSGGSRITGFQADGSGVWRARVPAELEFDELWMNGSRAVRARSPNSGYYYIRQAISEGEDRDGKPVDWFHRAFEASNPSDLAPLCGLSDAELSRAVAYVYYSWDGDWLRCDRVLGDRGILVFKEPSRLDFFYLWIKYETRYHLENFRAALDEPGEWFLDRAADEVLYIPKRGQRPRSSVAVVPRLRRLVRIRGTEDSPAHDIAFRNLVFSHTGYTMAGSMTGSQAGANLSAAVAGGHVRGVTFDNCQFLHMAEYALGFRFDCRECSVTRCCFRDLGGGGVQIGTTSWSPGQPTDGVTRSVRVEDCVFLQGGRRFPEGVAVAVYQASDCTVAHNDIADFFYTGISVGWTWGYADTVAHGNLVAYNRIRGIGQGVLSDMGGIYTLGRSPGTRIVGNVIGDVVSYNYTGSGSCGIYTDEGTSEIVVESNLVYRVKDMLVHQNYGRKNLFRNNIFAFPDPAAAGACMALGRAESPYSAALTNNIFVWRGKACAYKSSPATLAAGSFPRGKNLYWCYDNAAADAFGGKDFAAALAVGGDEGSVYADPLFKDPDAGDFTLKSNSPALGLGFVPFNVSLAGVRDPIRRGKLNAYRIPVGKPIPVPRRHEFPSKSSTGFEFKGLGPLTGIGGRIALTNGIARTGNQSLMVTDIQGQSLNYYPHLFTYVKADEGVFTFRFSVRYESGANMTCDLRKWKNGYDGEFITGPSLSLQDDKLRVRGAPPFALSGPDKWQDLEFIVRISGSGEASCDVSVSDASGKRETASCVSVDAGFDRPNWIGFTSVGTEEKSYWIDDLSFNSVP